mgnify:CR=1 FL=1
MAALRFGAGWRPQGARVGRDVDDVADDVDATEWIRSRTKRADGGRVGGRDKAVSAVSGGRARSDVVRRNGSRRSATMWVCVEVIMAPRFGPLCLLPLSPPWLEAVSRWASRAAEQQVAGSRQQAAGSKQQQAPMEPPRPGRPAARQREADGQSQTAEPETRAKGGGIGTVKKKCAKIDWTRQTQRGLALPALQFARLC